MVSVWVLSGAQPRRARVLVMEQGAVRAHRAGPDDGGSRRRLTSALPDADARFFLIRWRTLRRQHG